MPDAPLLASLFGDPALTALFADDQMVRCWLEVEGVLAHVQGELGIIPQPAAQAIRATSKTLSLDHARLREGMRQAGFPIIELVRQLRQAVGQAYGDYVHYGTTTQDIMDTAFVLQSRVALTQVEQQLRRVITNLAELAERHRHTLMAGRTHAQQALPITFGYKVANWLAPLLRHHERLRELRPRLLVVQLGGAVGTLASLGERGLDVQTALAHELQLAVPPMPWHNQRDGMAELANWLSLVSGSLAKMGQDIILLAQSEVAEVQESDDPSRGGSSAMPQKQNPILSEWIIAAARTNASLLSAIHQALIQEHERGTHGWQVEWLTLPQMFSYTGAALGHAAALSQNLQVNTAQMQANIRASNGLMLAEMIAAALAQTMPRTTAKQIVSEACRVAVAENRPLLDVLKAQTQLTLAWDVLPDESGYLGVAEQFIDRVLQEAHNLAN